MRIIKIIIADDHRIFTEGLRAVLKGDPDTQFEIVGIVHNGQELSRLLKKKPADILILDLNLPDMDGLEIITFIKNERISIRVLALSMYEQPRIIKSAFKAGVDGYILKSKGVDELFDAIDAVMQGNTYIGQGVAFSSEFHKSIGEKRKIHGFQFEDRFIKKHNLTKRELEILRLITQAMSNKEIGRELYISDQTVSVHRKNIMRKLGVSNTAGLLKVAFDNSLV
jgi:DNA-binding NarL/FixJ family response regulator